MFCWPDRSRRDVIDVQPQPRLVLVAHARVHLDLLRVDAHRRDCGRLDRILLDDERGRARLSRLARHIRRRIAGVVVRDDRRIACIQTIPVRIGRNQRRKVVQPVAKARIGGGDVRRSLLISGAHDKSLHARTAMRILSAAQRGCVCRRLSIVFLLIPPAERS